MCNSALMARGESNLMCLELVGGLMVVLDPRLLLHDVGPCFYSKVLLVNMKSDIALSKSMHQLVEGAVRRARVQ